MAYETMKKLHMHLTPLSIATFYACIGGIWLVFSSAKIITSLFEEHPAIQLLEINNIAFILVSSWMLYFLIRKSEANIKNR